MNKAALNSIVQRREGMGKTGETYIVGKRDDKIAYRTDRVIKQGGVGEDMKDFVEDLAVLIEGR